MRTLIVLTVLGALLLCASAAFAQYGRGAYGAAAPEKPYVRVKVGWFEPSGSDLDGDVAFALDYVVPYAAGKTIKQPWDGYVTIDRLHAEDSAVEWTSWNVMVGINLWVQEKYYYGGGFGWSRSTLERTGVSDRDQTDFAFELGVGARMGPKGFVEVKYRDAGQDGNRGPIVYAGTTF